MKFENRFFRISIEKIELSEEEKEAQRRKRKKRKPFAILALLLVVAIIGCGVLMHLDKDTVQQASGGKESGSLQASQTPQTPQETEAVSGKQQKDEHPLENQETENNEVYGQVEGEYVTTSKLASGLQEKYADRTLYNYTYAAPIENVGRKEAITFQLGYDVNDLQIEKWYEVFGIYQDPELTQRMSVKYSFDEETKTFIMEPTEWEPPCQISAYGLDVNTVDRLPHSEMRLYDNGAGSSWGNLGTAYLASYRDKETGEMLDEPEVSIVTFRGEIEEAPRLTYAVTNDGLAQFFWNEVEGATEYMVCEITRTQEKGYTETLQVLELTKETEWVTDPPTYEMSLRANEDFKTFVISEDDWKAELGYESNVEKFGEPGKPYYFQPYDETRSEKGICVIAINDEGTSMISNVYMCKELAPNLPCEVAVNTERENGFAPFAQTYESVQKLPIYDYITMCDGYTNTKLIDYETERAYLTEKKFILVDSETRETTGSETALCLMIPYRVEGTPFRDEFVVSGYDKTDMEADLAFLDDREGKLRKKSGDVSPEFSLKFATHEDLMPRQIRKVETQVVANSALSEYLAVNLLGGVKSIDVSEFPEAADKALLDDAFLEAYYQNPLIMGIRGYRISNRNATVRVVYEESLEEQAEKQQAVQEKVTEIIGEIITEDMSDREKELAINTYLCDTIVYDEDALLSAEEHNFMFVDDVYDDSFTAYGALINGKCVCAGYAAAFHLLAREAGLESIVVTGFLDGNLAHAWNKIKIDNEWQIVDVTNNDNEYFYNALMNLPSKVGDRVLVEDKDYAMDKMLSGYVSESDANEYYHITDNYFPTREVAEKLSAELSEKGEVTLRTDYALNDTEFYEITDAVYDIMGDEVDLYGYHWLGVIYLSVKEE